MARMMKLTINVLSEPPCIIEVSSNDNPRVVTMILPFKVSLIFIKNRIVKVIETDNIISPAVIDILLNPRMARALIKSITEQIHVAIMFILCILFIGS